MTIYNKSGKKTGIQDSHFLTSGGEADVYLKDGIIYKIFQKERSHDFVKKLNILQNLNKSNIINPKDVFYDSNNNFVGYSMKYLHNAESLTKLFTKSYKSRNSITLDNLLKMVESLKDTTNYIHKNKCLIVDGNENNFLFEKKNVEIPYFIDIDSYQTPNHKATAFSPLITDPFVMGSKAFTEMTDWYSFAIITFQLLTNIHPFKGRHPNYTKKDVLLRMENNISVFDSKVNLPASVEDFDVIPKNLLSWYKEVFVEGKREIPPMDLYKNAPIIPKEISLNGSDKLKITEIKDIRKKELFKMNDKNMDYNALSSFVNNKNVSIISNDAFIELSSGILKLQKSSYKVLATILQMNVPSNTKLYGGVVHYSIFKKNHFVVATETELIHANLNALDSHTILDCSYKNNVLVVSSIKDKKYFVSVFKQDTGFSRAFDNGIEIEVDAPSECNYIVLKNGMVVLLNSDEDLILTHVKKDQYKTLRNVKIPLDGNLCTDAYGEKVLLDYKNKVYQIEMK